MTEAIVDASVLLASFWGEPVVEDVERLLEAGGANDSAVNLAEAVNRLLDKGTEPKALTGLLAGLKLDVIPFDEDRAMAAALLRPATRHLGLSLGDRACLSLAKEFGAPALTTDRAWLALDIGVDVRLARPATP